MKAADQFGPKGRDRVLQVGIRACLILGLVWGYVFTTRPAAESHGLVVMFDVLLCLKDYMRFISLD